MLTPLNVRDLRVGAVLPQAIYSARGAKLAPRGATVSPSLLATLRGYHGVMYLGYPFRAATPEVEAKPAGVDLLSEDALPRAAEPRATPAPAREDDRTARDWRVRLKRAEEIAAERSARWAGLPLRVGPGEAWLRWPADPAARAHAERTDDLRAARSALVRRAGALLDALARGREADGAAALSLASDVLQRVAEAPERAARFALLHDEDAEPVPQHAVATACVAALVAGRLGWSIADAGLAATAGLLADAGLMLLPERLRRAGSPLDDAEWNRVRRHPAVSVAMLDLIPGLDERARMAVMQHHEREDGSGYPLRLRGAAISDAAAVVGVADAFAGSAAPRAYRLTPRTPHDAMTDMLRMAASGALRRPVVRALVEAVGVYPAGSTLRLTSGERALSLAVNPGRPARPVVRILSGRNTIWEPGAGAGQVIDLASCEDWELGVERALEPASAQWADAVADAGRPAMLGR